jgi:2'-5' RNA ligase
MSNVRAFIAIDLPDALQKAISLTIEQLQLSTDKTGVRWMPASNIHLTLKFLGEVPLSNMNVIQQLLNAEVSTHPHFKITVGHLGAFPNIKRPRVVWLGVEKPIELVALQRGIENATAKLGYPIEERPFSPHLTLGRVRENASSPELAILTAALERIKINYSGYVPVESVHFYKSELLSTGAVYTQLFSASLS